MQLSITLCVAFSLTSDFFLSQRVQRDQGKEEYGDATSCRWCFKLAVLNGGGIRNVEFCNCIIASIIINGSVKTILCETLGNGGTAKSPGDQ